MDVVLIGPPGCGKGTQSQRLCDALGLCHLSTGEMLREAMRQCTPIGKRVETLLLQGNLVSDDLVLDLVAERLGKPACRVGCLFDGVPRTLRQAEMLDALLEEHGLSVTVAIEIDVNDAELARRILRRAQFEDRADDTLETFKKRLEIYRTETTPILQLYQQQGVMRRIDGEGTPDDVFQRLMEELQSR